MLRTFQMTLVLKLFLIALFINLGRHKYITLFDNTRLTEGRTITGKKKKLFRIFTSGKEKDISYLQL